MDAQDRKLNERITHRKEKVQRLIEQQEAILAALGPIPDHLHQQDYFRALLNRHITNGIRQHKRRADPRSIF